MKIGFVGLGKLGLPCAVAIAAKGHNVMGYDVNPELMSKKPRLYRETGPDGVEPFNPILEKSSIRFGTLQELAVFSEIIFIAVQTPHNEKFEGTTRLPEDREDFDYSYLCSAVSSLAAVVTRRTVVVIISTVLPGTLRKHVLPLTGNLIKICYNPFFIAMGTTMRDFLYPEFVLFGVHDKAAAAKAENFYRSLISAPFYKTTVENAELIKVSYNTFIGMKIVFANTLMEICHKMPGVNVDEVTNALKLASRRLISGAYLSGGMGDGGACHPRDNIAMSSLARRLDMRYDFFEFLMLAREKQTEWLADLIIEESGKTGLPVVLLGKSFKEGTNIMVGSPAILLFSILKERGIHADVYDPHIDNKPGKFEKSAVFFIATRHPEFLNFSFPANSVVIDPWRYLKDNIDGVRYIGVGSGKK